MGKLVVTEFVTLDGVMEDPGGAEGSPWGGWGFEFDFGEEGGAFKYAEIMEADANLLGRKTYDGFAAAWPSREGEFADRLNTSPKYVVSSTLEDPEWENTSVLKGDPAEEVAKLKEQTEGVILVAGSRQLVQMLLRNDLVDELRIMIYPVVVGGGMRLFEEGLDRTAYELVESKPVGDGIVLLVYRPK